MSDNVMSIYPPSAPQVAESNLDAICICIDWGTIDLRQYSDAEFRSVKFQAAQVKAVWSYNRWVRTRLADRVGLCAARIASTIREFRALKTQDRRREG